MYKAKHPLLYLLRTDFGRVKKMKFADFRDALNLPSPWNELSIPLAYAASQFNALTPYYPIWHCRKSTFSSKFLQF